MAISTFPFISFSGTAAAVPVPRFEGRRRIDFRAGRALEKLGHAIEYVSEEFIHDPRPVKGHDSRLEAISLLMSLNRAVYFECPVTPTFGQRLRSIVRRQS